MTHLTDAQMTDVIDGAGDAIAVAHIAACARCRSEVDDYQKLLRVLRDDEPAPAIEAVETFANRVQSRIEASRETERSGETAGSRRLLLVAAMFVIAVGLAVVASYFAVTPGPASERTLATDRPAPREATLDSGDGDAAWILLQALAEELDYDEAREAGVVAAPGSLERAALELSTEEQAALIRLIEAELKRTQS